MVRSAKTTVRPPESKLTAQGVVLRTTSPQDFSRFLDNEVKRWSKVVKDNKITAQ